MVCVSGYKFVGIECNFCKKLHTSSNVVSSLPTARKFCYSLLSLREPDDQQQGAKHKNSCRNIVNQFIAGKGQVKSLSLGASKIVLIPRLGVSNGFWNKRIFPSSTQKNTTSGLFLFLDWSPRKLKHSNKVSGIFIEPRV